MGESNDQSLLIRLQGLSGDGGMPGICPAETEDEVWQLMELHASVAHGEDRAAWTAEDRAQLKTPVKSEAADN